MQESERHPNDSLARAPDTAASPNKDAKGDEGVDTTADLIAGWLGGAVGVLVGNPFEVLKVRLQTQDSHGGSSSSSGTSSGSSHSHHPSTSTTTSHASPRVGKSSFSPLPSPAFPFPPAPISASKSASPPTPPKAARTADGSSRLAGSSPSSLKPPSATAEKQKQQKTTRPGIVSLYRSEGIRFFFAGTAGPILGLAFIDSAFFGLYGRMMQTLGQDRQDPNSLSRVALSGAMAGAMCAMLETPIEVVKTRAQVESIPGKKLGSFKIASQIARKEGLRGFYIGGLMTAVHDGISSGIFFFGYFVFRRLLRGESPFQAAAPSPLESLAAPTASTPTTPSAPSPDEPPISPPTTTPGMGNVEVLRIMLAGGLAGALSAIVPYPFDIVKTRLQTANFATRARTNPVSWAASGPHEGTNFTSNATPFHTRPVVPTGPAVEPVPTTAATGTSAAKPTVRSLFRGIHAEGVAQYRYRYPSTWVYQFLSTYVFPTTGPKTTVLDARAEKWALRVLGLGGFARGIRPTVVSSFVGSAATITTVEVALHLMGVNGGGGGGVG
ncbi:hypothetical protein JCM10908_002660 [Rhodotorula pacifica]|uniref:uncharacterized protein n=1 Tax=Rhodotorula pacifica TaxID=1495444 RepID=UPI0031774B36